MDRVRALRVAGYSTPIVGAAIAGASLAIVARVVDRSGCTGYEFDCLDVTINAVLVALIVCLMVAVALQWVVALSAVDGDGPRLGHSLALAVGGGISWVLLSVVAALWLRGALNALAVPQGGASVGAAEHLVSLLAVVIPVLVFGWVTVVVVRRGSTAVGILMLVALAAVTLGCCLPSWAHWV
jgi:hypothetical protein